MLGFKQPIIRDPTSSDNGDTNEKANPERGWLFVLVGPPRVELGTNGFRFV